MYAIKSAKRFNKLIPKLFLITNENYQVTSVIKNIDRSFHLNKSYLSKWSKKANKDNK